MDKNIQKKLTAIAAAVLLMVCCFGFGMAGSTYAAESRVTDMSPEEILVAVADPAATSDVYVYAPTIYWIDSNLLIFGNGTGLVIYDMQAEKVSGLVDMQAICSDYYNSDSMFTHVMVQGSDLIVYNTRTGSGEVEVPFGYYHKFDLSQLKGDGSILTSTESGDDKDVISGLMKQGSEYEALHYLDAWDYVSYIKSSDMLDAEDYYGASYSEKAFVHKGADGSEYLSIIYTKGVKVNDEGIQVSDEPFEYGLMTEKIDNSAEYAHSLQLGITKEVRDKVKKLTALPEFKYTGDDKALGVICESIASGDNSWYGDKEEGSVIIPAPVVFDKVEKDGELLVFGNFWSETYIRQGNTLITTSGGEMPACFHLRKSGSTYEIASIDVAEDGEGYMESIKKFTDGFPGLYEKYASTNTYDETVRHEMLRAYSEANNLGIKYYKDYGWDPIEL